MLINCPSCTVKYLLNSAELGNDGRIVKCIKCNYEWMQRPNLISEEKTDTKENTILHNHENYNKMLPSTYVEKKEPSLLNSFFMVFFVIFIISLYFVLKNLDQGIINLIIFYFLEFFNNIDEIIKDFAKIFYNIIN